jgi:hypothetical protein
VTSGITFTIQKHSHLANASTANPEVKIDGRKILLEYDDLDRLCFVDAVSYRVGCPNDEGFYGGGNPGTINNSIYSSRDFPELKFGYFYEVEGFDWSNGLVGDNVHILLECRSWEFKNIKHFVYFMKDGTFEYLCRKWHEV